VHTALPKKMKRHMSCSDPHAAKIYGDAVGKGRITMDQKTFSLVAGLIFAVVALFHLARIFAQCNLIIGDWSVPKSINWVAVIVAVVLPLSG